MSMNVRIKPVCLVQAVTYSGMTHNTVAEEENFHATSSFMDFCHHLRMFTKWSSCVFKLWRSLMYLDVKSALLICKIYREKMHLCEYSQWSICAIRFYVLFLLPVVQKHHVSTADSTDFVWHISNKVINNYLTLWNLFLCVAKQDKADSCDFVDSSPHILVHLW